MDLPRVVLLFGSGVLGGAANAVAGDGTFFTFPALMASRLDPLVANASNALAIYPGHAAVAISGPAWREWFRRRCCAASS